MCEILYNKFQLKIYTKLEDIFYCIIIYASGMLKLINKLYYVLQKVSHPAPVKGAGAFKIPPDNGFSNYGDNLWEGRDPGDALLTREVSFFLTLF